MCKRFQQTLIIQYTNISLVSFQGRSFKCLNSINVYLYQIELIELAMWGGVYASYCKARDVEKVYKHRDLILCYRKLNVAQIVNLSHTIHHNGKLHTVFCPDKVLLAFYIAVLKTLARDSSLYLLRSSVVGNLIPVALLSSQLLATSPVYQTLREKRSAFQGPASNSFSSWIRQKCLGL